MIASEKHPIQGKKIQTNRKQIFRHMEIFAKKEKAPSKFILRKHWVFFFWISQKKFRQLSLEETYPTKSYKKESQNPLLI